jgi:transposase
MRIGRPKPILTLNEEERETLEQWIRRPKTAQALAQRARIVLACATEESNTLVAEKMNLTKQCVGKWRSRFVVKRLDGLLDEARPGAPRIISDAKVERRLL